MKSLLTEPQISVIIPLYNHEDYIEEAINSVLNQSVDNFELIVINDGSTDRSEEIVNSVKDKRIKYYYQQNRGAHFTINRGIELARGMYVSILNSDDCYAVNRFEKCLDVYNSDSSIDAVFSGIDHVDEKGDSVKITLRSEENYVGLDGHNSFKDLNNLTLDLLAGNFLKTTSNLFCRKACFDEIGSFRGLRYAHDYDFFLRLSAECSVAVLEEPLLKYRSHPHNTLKEGQAAIDLECALVILDFVTKKDLSTFINNYDSGSLYKLFNSLNTHRSDKILFITAMFSNLMQIDNKNILEEYLRNPTHSYWVNARNYLQHYHDGWQAREELMDEWNKLHKLYRASEEGQNKSTEFKNCHMAIKNYFKNLYSKWYNLFSD